MSDIDRPQLVRVADALGTAWNEADGSAFASSFTQDADFVNIYAAHLVGRVAIGKQHQAIFDGVYRGSRIAFTLTKARSIADGVILAHVAAELHVPQGPMAGDVRTLATAVFVRTGSVWSIMSFQNTREQPPPGAPLSHAS